MNLRRRNKSTAARFALHPAIPFKDRQSMTRSHEADAMDAGQLALGTHGIAGLEMGVLNFLQDGGLDSSVGRRPVLAWWHIHSWV